MALVCTESDRAKNFKRTLGFQLLRRNIAPLHFNTERVAETAFAHRDFDQLWLDFPELGGYFPVLGTLN